MADVIIDEGNAAQAEEWNGGTGGVWAANEAFFDAGVREHHAALLNAAVITADDVVLDLGCGNGQTTRDAARAAFDGSATGIDLSSAMLAQARRTADADGIKNVSFIRGDAQVYPFEPETFSLAISRFGSMFFSDQTAAFSNVSRALRPGGRLALASWQGVDQNEWIRELRNALAAGRDLPAPPPDAPTPFRHADPDAVRAILTDAGFQDIHLEDVHLPIFQGGDAETGFAVITALFEWMFEGLDDQQRAGAKDALRAAMKRHETADGVFFDSAIWLITATRP